MKLTNVVGNLKRLLAGDQAEDLPPDLLSVLVDGSLRTEQVDSLLAGLADQSPEACRAAITGVLGQVAKLLETSTSLLNNLLSITIGLAVQITGAERGTLFLVDPETGELFSRVLHGDEIQEIRLSPDTGIACSIMASGKAEIIGDVHSDARFNQEIDRQSGFVTKSILGSPMRVAGRGEPIGVIELLNKKNGAFTTADLAAVEEISVRAAAALRSARDLEMIRRSRENETRMQEVTAAISSELNLKPLLEKIMQAVIMILDTDRATLFLHDEKTNELWSQVALGLNDQEIRFPAHLGIAGKVFTSGETVNIPDAYADPRFNKEIDKKTGYRTKNILCMPVVNRTGKTIGVTQVLNKRAGVFTRIDEKKLKTFSAQAAIAIENAKLFDEVLNMKNYSESILESLSNGVITVNAARKIEKCNAVALRTFGVTTGQITGKYADIFFTGDNHWIVDSLRRVIATQEADNFLDAEIVDRQGHRISMNMAVAPLHDSQDRPMGGLLAFEDLTGEKRLKSTLSRYMNKEVADQLLNSDGMLGGKMQELTVLFSDIRNFTTISERLGAQETVAMLNEYFTTMVDIVFHHGGILDKFIGDAMLAVFGAPFTSSEDADRAVITAIEMQRALKEFNGRRLEKGLQTIDIGVGVNTDTVLVGNIGSLKRMDYTVIGDGVNLASRLEGANKFYGTSILVSENSFGRLIYPHRTREVDLLRVKGKNLPAKIYEILDHHDTSSFPNMDELLSRYESALELYRKREWEAAGRSFAEALRLNPADTLSKVYAERCAHFLLEPPPDDWDGIWVMHSKS